MIALAKIVMAVAAAAVVITGRACADDTHGAHTMHDMPGMAMPAHAYTSGHPAPSHDHADEPSSRAMHGFYGLYPMQRETSGTSWQPDSAPLEGVHVMQDEWIFMLHGFCNATWDIQGGPRGDEMWLSTNMLAFMAQHPLFGGTWGLRAMSSLEPTLGRDGYPLLLQTGETADGVTHLIDRQHPHDLMMELATTYSYPLSPDSSAFFYFGCPGEPALGPTAFMHRYSGEVNPEAPITHHWLDSTHITYGVITFGYIREGIKIENSFFRGREPDQFRWNIETPRFDSYAVRLTVNPSDDLSCQVSYGHLVSPEQLSPDTDVDRLTASITYNKNFRGGLWQTTVAYGQNWSDPGHALPAFLAETAVTWREAYTVFGRAELVRKDELFSDEDPRAGQTFTVGKTAVGCLYDFFKTKNATCGIGYVASLSFFPDSLDDAYGDAPWSQMLFLHVSI